MPSPFKKYRQAFAQDADSYDPSRILTNAMNPQTPPPEPVHRKVTQGDPRDFGFDGTPQPRFGQPIDIPNAPDYRPVFDHAMEQGEQMDDFKARDRQYKTDQFTSGLQGFAQGLAAGVGTQGNFGESFAAALGTATAVTAGSMQKAQDRRAVEEARTMEIEQLFFNRSVKLQELSNARRKAEAEVENARLDREMRGRQIDVTERRADISEDRLDEAERHNQEMESIGQTNARANTTRAQTYERTGGARAAKAAPRSAQDIDNYARTRVYIQFGAADEQGNITDPQKKAQIDDQLQRTSGRRKTRVQEAYDRARSEATKSTVDPSAGYEDDSE